MRSTKITETQIAAPVVEHLQEQGWDVYQEVQTADGGRADIVCTRGPLVWVVEAKTSLSLQLLDQVVRWRGNANYVSIAIPEGKYHHGSFVNRYLRDLGFGVFSIHVGGAHKWDVPSANVSLRPSLFRRADTDRLKASLNEKQKCGVEAGSKGGGFWTPFKETCDRLVEYLKAHPGASLKDVIENVEHHYHTSSSARSSLSHWIRVGKVPGVKWNGRRLELVEGGK